MEPFARHSTAQDAHITTPSPHGIYLSAPSSNVMAPAVKTRPVAARPRAPRDVQVGRAALRLADHVRLVSAAGPVFAVRVGPHLCEGGQPQCGASTDPGQHDRADDDAFPKPVAELGDVVGPRYYGDRAEQPKQAAQRGAPSFSRLLDITQRMYDKCLRRIVPFGFIRRGWKVVGRRRFVRHRSVLPADTTCYWRMVWRLSEHRRRHRIRRFPIQAGPHVHTCNCSVRTPDGWG